MDKIDSFLQKEYVPISDFLQKLAELNPFPYQSTFSFKPFLNKYMCTIGGICSHTASEMTPKIEYLEKMVSDGWLSKDSEEFDGRLNSAVALLMPSLLFNNEPAFLAPPFVKNFVYSTPAQKELMASGQWELKINSHRIINGKADNIQQAGGLILNRYYDQKTEIFSSQIITLRHTEHGIERHYKMTFDYDFVDIELKKPLKKLTESQISELYHNVDDTELWLKYLPLENFAFTGFGIGRMFDVTKLEVLSILKDQFVLNNDQFQSDVFLPTIEKQVIDYIGCPKIRVGIVGVAHAEFMGGNSFSLTGTNDISLLSSSTSGSKSLGAYHEVQKSMKPAIKENLDEGPLSVGEQRLKENGIGSVILFPTHDVNGKIAALFEITSPFPRAFNPLHLGQLREVFDLLQIGSDNYFRDLDNRRGMFIQKQFTSIHPSVEWKFEEVAQDYEVRKTLPDFDGMIQPIVFKDIYPLYGQADIVSSSSKRNASIQADLLTNLAAVEKLMKLWSGQVRLHLLDAYIMQVCKRRAALKKQFISSDESQIVDLLVNEIHPLLAQLKEEYPQVPEEPYQEYIDSLDPQLGILYQARKRYEHSVSILNSSISDFVESDDEVMQKTLPHYFEKYKTDGVEYNLYVGQALLKDQKFSHYHLKEFRLWQLVQMCKITQLVDKVSKELPVPLQTAQLVFVYNNSLSIRFRMDEKQFDVDGAYNVRYEILKKRIDKAKIKGTNERLTVAGKVSIVYLQDKDKAEYLEYINFLVDSGYIKKDYEELELEKMQGADGLKALRLEVVMPTEMEDKSKKRKTSKRGARTLASVLN